MSEKRGELRMQWSRSESDLVVVRTGEGVCDADGELLSTAITMTPIAGGKTLWGHLAERGYDVTTLRFSIRRTKARDA